MNPLCRVSSLPKLLVPVFALLLGIGGCAKVEEGQLCANSSACATGLDCVSSVCLKPCTTDEACGSDQACGAGYCAKACKAQGDCPSTQACGLPTATATSPSCYNVQYQNPTTGGFGTDCSLYNCQGADGGPNPCASGFSCFSFYKCDPYAVCSAGCKSDVDCPASYFCATFNDSHGNPAPSVCAPRSRCDACATDDACQATTLTSTYLCAHDDIGGRFCAKPCNSDADCLKPYNAEDSSGNTFFLGHFETCQADPVSKLKVCTPSQGACHGKSGVAAITTEGGLCAACRPGVPGDCAAPSDTAAKGCLLTGGSGPGACFPCPSGAASDCTMDTFCHEVTTPGESYCSQNCFVDMSLNSSGYSFSHDTCPTGMYCFFGGPGVLGDLAYSGCNNGDQGCCGCLQTGGACNCGLQVPGLCTADSKYEGDTCYPTQGG
jgi:hypothetical protein